MQPAAVAPGENVPVPTNSIIDDGSDPTMLHQALRMRWLTMFFVLLFATMVGWAVATPTWGSADEYQHAYRAYAAVRGAIYVKPEPAVRETGGYVDVPLGWKRSQFSIACYAGTGIGSPSCLPPLTNLTTPVRLPSTVARYNPAYYLIVGLPSLTFSPSRALIGMRFASGGLSAFFLAWALSSAMSARRPRLVAASVLLAVTPMVVFLGAAVNPNGLEISAALACWVSLAMALQLPMGRSRSVLVRRAAMSACALVVTRGLSPVWLLVIVVVVMVFLGLRRPTQLFAADLIRWEIVVFAATVFATLWTVFAKTLDVGVLGPHTHYSLAHRFDLAWGGVAHQRFLLYGAVGNFGWLDVPLPHVILLPYLTIAGLLCIAGLIAGTRRQRVTLVLLGVAVVAIPTLLDAVSWNRVGSAVWAPRYSLPIQVGLLTLAGLMIAGRLRTGRLANIAIPAVLVACATATNIAAFVKVLSRYVVGPTHAITLSGGLWQPPLGGWTVTIVESAAWVLLGAAVFAAPTWQAREVRASAL